MIGIFGGTFDPVHTGHLQLAEQAINRLNLDEVQFLPCANPVHRPSPTVSSDHRLRMLERAIIGYPRMRVNTIEIDRGGPSYMVDSLRQMSGRQTLCLLIGVDAFNSLYNWRSPEQILSLAHLVVCRRPGLEIDTALYPDHQVNSVAALQNSDHGCIVELDINENPCSSTEVRELLSRGKTVTNCLPQAVLEYINQHHLYEKQ